MKNQDNSRESDQAPVIGRFYSDFLLEPLDFTGDPLRYEWRGNYGILVPIGEKVYFFYFSGYDTYVEYEELSGWRFSNVL